MASIVAEIVGTPDFMGCTMLDEYVRLSKLEKLMWS
jgi:hypothetical protein